MPRNRFKDRLYAWGHCAVRRADNIERDREPLYPDTGTETVDYIKGSVDDLLVIASRCLYEVAMRESKDEEE